MYHSLTFYPENLGFIRMNSDNYGTRNTWTDWHLIPSSRPVITPPQQKTSIVDVPGSYGSIDASLSLTGYPVYGLREGSITFYTDPSFMDWATLYTTIQNYLHGQFFRVILEDDASFYYYGRMTVDGMQPGQSFSAITISYSLYPFKKELTSSNEDWLWDPFSFVNGIIRDYRNIEVPAGPDGVVVTIPTRAEYIVPIIETTGPCKLFYPNDRYGKTYDIPAGITEDPNIVIGAPGYAVTSLDKYPKSAYYELKFTATSPCTIKRITYQGGSL